MKFNSIHPIADDAAPPDAAGRRSEVFRVSETEVGSEANLIAPKRNLSRRRRKVKKNTYEGLLRSYDGLAAAFIVPMVIMVIIFIQRGIFPFGEESFLRTDMYHQYAPFFSEFQHKLKHGGSLLYSWDIGMGVNFMALYAYYLASPLNWLLLLCPKGLVIEFMTYMIVLKSGLSGLTMAWYLRRHCRKIDIGVAFFGIFYAMSGYMAAYSWNIMWLDCILLFPLIVLGLEQLVKERKGMLYCVTLGLSILSNYYISIMICIFMVLYFIALLVLEEKMSWKKFIGRCGRFTIFSLLAGGIAAAVLLPEIFALQMTASGDVNFPKTFSAYFPIFDIIARHIGNVQTETGLEHWPNIYCGVAVLMFFLLYLGSRQVKAKEKAVYCTLLLIFFASFSINVLNFIWHGFHYPNSLPCRQSFIYIFIMLLICYRAYMHLDEIPKKHISMAFFTACGFVILAQKLVTDDDYHFSVFYVALLFLALYLGLVFLYRQDKKYHVTTILLALSVVSIEAAVNMTVTSVVTTSRTAYIADNQDVETLVSTLPGSPEFYRVEKVARKTKNDGAWMNFPSVSLFSSTANADLSDFFKKIGCESSTNAYSITGSTPLVDMLFGVKYGLYSGEAPPSGIRRLLEYEGETYLYENRYSLPVAWLVSNSFEQDWYVDIGNPADVQNGLADLTGSAHVLLQVMDGELDGTEYRFTPDQDGGYYAYIDSKQVEKVNVVKESGTEYFNNINRGYMVDIGCCDAGEEVIIRSETSGQNLSAMVYRFSEEALGQIYDRLNETPLVLDYLSDTKLRGTIDAKESGLLFTSIPYDNGWTVKIDGERCETNKIIGAFLSVEVPDGSHTIEFEFVPEGFHLGYKITIGSVIILLLIFLTGQYLRKRKRKAWEPDEFEEDDKFRTGDEFGDEEEVGDEEEFRDDVGIEDDDHFDHRFDTLDELRGFEAFEVVKEPERADAFEAGKEPQEADAFETGKEPQESGGFEAVKEPKE